MPPIPRPEPSTAHLVRIRLPHHPICQVRHTARMQRRTPARKPRHRQIERPPEKVHRAAIAHKPRPKLPHHPPRPHQHSPEPIRCLRVILPMPLVLPERRSILQLTRHRPNPHPNPHLPNHPHKLPIKIRYRPRPQFHLPHHPPTRAHPQPVPHKIKLNLHHPPFPPRHRPPPESPPPPKTRHIPKIINPPHQHHPPH